MYSPSLHCQQGNNSKKNPNENGRRYTSLEPSTSSVLLFSHHIMAFEVRDLSSKLLELVYIMTLLDANDSGTSVVKEISSLCYAFKV